jgi:hypothetical protein
VFRSRPERKIVVSDDRAAGESIAAPIPCTKRAPMSSDSL